MKISFVLPCYNVEQYVEKCIESIYAMNDDDIEVIAVNDGSTDKTLSILKELKNKYGIKVINLGSASGYAGRPRNVGLDAASGTYIAFMDPDDYYLGSELLNSYEQYKGYDVIVNSFKICNPDGKITDTIKLKNKEVNRQKFLWGQIKNVCNQRTLFKRQFLKDNNIRFYEDCRSQDLIFLYTVYCAGATFRLTNLVTTMYLDERVDSVSNIISDKYIETSIIAYERFFKVIESNLSSNEVKSAIGEHFLGYYLKVRGQLTSEQKAQLLSTDFYKYIKSEIVNSI